MKTQSVGCISNPSTLRPKPRPEIIQRPFLNFNLQDELLDQFVEQYNQAVRIKRLQELTRRRKKALLEGRELTGKEFQLGEEYQLIKEAHINLMKAIVRAAGQQMLRDNDLFNEKGLIKLHRCRPDEPYRLFTSNQKLRDNRYKACSTRSVWNQLQRLKTCGFIREKVFHGTKADFEVLINPDFLLIFDSDNREYLPESPLLGSKGIQGLQEGSRKILPPLRKERLTLKKSITHVQKESSAERASGEQAGNRRQPSDVFIKKSKINTQENEPRGKETPGGGAAAGFSTQQVDNTSNPNAPRNALDPKLRRFITEQVEMLLRIALLKLWGDRTIFPAVIDQAREMILSQYFQGIKAQARAEEVLKVMYWCMDRQLKWKQKDPDRFVLLPLQFFDLERKLGKNDYSGMAGGVKMYKEKFKRDKEFAAKSRALNNRRRFLKALTTYRTNPGPREYLRLENFIKNHLPQYLEELLILAGEGRL